MKRITLISSAFFVLIICFISVQAQDGPKRFGIILHGGAGSYEFTPQEEEVYLKVFQIALDSGYSILERGGSSLDAVEKAINIMEESHLFNAGRGSVLNEKGFVEMDASIMEGKNLNAGAVAGIRKFLHPISIARKVMENTRHLLLAGEGAEEFARSLGFKEYPLDSLLPPKKNSKPQNKKGTVGAVAIDKEGNIAAGTSTGGTSNKMLGRIGDSPIIGAGTYANNQFCGISCTGVGEYFIKQSAAFHVYALMAFKNYSLKKAIDEVLEKIQKMGATGGMIGIDNDSGYAWGFTTPGMPVAIKMSDGTMIIKIFKNK